MNFWPLKIGKYLLLTVTTGNFGLTGRSALGPWRRWADVTIGPCGPNLSPVGLCPTCVPPCGLGGIIRRPDRSSEIAARWGVVIGRARVVVVRGCLTGRFDIAARCGGAGRVTLRWGAVGRDTP